MFGTKSQMIEAERALTGRSESMPVPERHTMLGTSLVPSIVWRSGTGIDSERPVRARSASIICDLVPNIPGDLRLVVLVTTLAPPEMVPLFVPALHPVHRLDLGAQSGSARMRGPRAATPVRPVSFPLAGLPGAASAPVPLSWLSGGSSVGPDQLGERGGVGHQPQAEPVAEP